MHRAKITIVGAGNVGATTAHWCAAAELGDIVLVDIPATGDMPKGKSLDLMQAMPIIGSDVQVLGTTEYGPTANSDVVVITAGVPRKPGMSRDDLLTTNAKIVSAVAQQIKDTSPQSIVIVVSNPLDAMVQCAAGNRLSAAPRPGSGRRAGYRSVPHFPGHGTGRQRRGCDGLADGWPWRHDGPHAELYVRRRYPGRSIAQPRAARTRSWSERAMEARRSSTC